MQHLHTAKERRNDERRNEASGRGERGYRCMLKGKLTVRSKDETRASEIQGKDCQKQGMSTLHITSGHCAEIYLVRKASTVVCVFCILDDLCCQEEVDKGGGVAIHAPASDRVHEVGPKQSSFKVVHIPAGHTVIQPCKLTCTQS